MLVLVVTSIAFGCIYGALGVGYSMIYKASGLLSLAQGEMLMVGAFVGLTTVNIVKSFWIALPVTAAVMFLLGVLVERVFVSTLMQRGGSLAYVMLLTSSISMLLSNGVMLTYGANARQFPPVFGEANTTVTLLGMKLRPEYILLIVIAVVMMAVLQTFLNKSKLGTAMRAAALDEKAASAVGISVPRTKSMAWGIAAAMAGVVGMCLAPTYVVVYWMGAQWGSKAFAGAVVGGYGNLYGAIVGGLTVAFVEMISTLIVPTTMKDFVSFAVLIIVLVVRPSGIFNAKVLE
jgi:branched-chain amino acid transport system permease protein